MVAKYSFNSGDATDEIGSNDGTVNGASLTADRFGNPNAAYHFDGVDDYIDFGDATAFQFGWNDFSYSIWFKLDTAQYSALFGKSSLQSLYSINFGGDNVDPLNISMSTLCRMMHKENNDFRTVNTLELDTTSWHHAVVIHRYNDSTSLFIDNQFIGSDNTSYQNHPEGFNISGTNLVLGRHGVFSIHFRGDADDIRMYDRALDVQEVDSLYSFPNVLEHNEIGQQTFQLYPNPVANQLTVSGDAIVGGVIDVVGLDGKIIERFIGNATGKLTIDVSEYVGGVYFLTVETNSGIHSRKFIVK
jgi:hypothetical protein